MRATVGQFSCGDNATFLRLFRRFLSRLTALHVLLVVGVLEVAINRIAVPMLRPRPKGMPPSWHTMLDYGGLFLFYFTGRARGARGALPPRFGIGCSSAGAT